MPELVEEGAVVVGVEAVVVGLEVVSPCMSPLLLVNVETPFGLWGLFMVSKTLKA